MKFALLSDLHVDTNPWELAEDVRGQMESLDAVIIAGDISDDASFSMEWIGERLRQVPVYFVFGNHEYRAPESWQEGRDEARRVARRYPNIRLLDRDAAYLGDVRLLGCCLWVDFAATGDPDGVMAEAAIKNPDHHLIQNRQPDGTRENFTPPAMREQHQTELAWLSTELRTETTATKTIVITHYPPLPQSIESDPRARPILPMLTSDLSQLISGKGPDLWIHGHIHHRCDYQVDGTRILANPRGSPPYTNSEFRSLEIIEI